MAYSLFCEVVCTTSVGCSLSPDSIFRNCPFCYGTTFRFFFLRPPRFSVLRRRQKQQQRTTTLRTQISLESSTHPCVCTGIWSSQGQGLAFQSCQGGGTCCSGRVGLTWATCSTYACFVDWCGPRGYVRSDIGQNLGL